MNCLKDGNIQEESISAAVDNNFNIERCKGKENMNYASGKRYFTRWQNKDKGRQPMPVEAVHAGEDLDKDSLK